MDKPVPISVAEAKAKLSEKIRACTELDRTFLITSHGKPRAVLMSYEAYANLAEGERQPKTIDLKAWKQTRTKRREVARDIKNLFEETKLSRKGQKGYKRRAVKKMEGNNASIEDLIIDHLCAYKFEKSGIEGVKALMIMELGEHNQNIIDRKAIAVDVLDAMDHIRMALERVIRERLPRDKATELVEIFIKR
jgi:prevent-host-death family protein